MSLECRLLPRDEWPRLAETYLAPVLARLPETDAEILVVEEDGQIVATWSVLTATHVEGLWIAPSARHRAGVGRRLLTGMWRLLKDRDVSAVVTHAETDDIRGMLQTIGAERIPGEAYLVPVRKD